MFVSFEGVDGTGKSTVINKIQKELSKDYKVILYNEPSNQYGRTAKFGDPGLKKLDLLYLWWTARRYELNKLENQNYDIVLADRYYDSTHVYLNEYLDDVMIQQNYNHNHFVKPDITFVLYCPTEVLIERIKERTTNDAFESLDFNTIDRRNEMFKYLTMTTELKRNIQMINSNQDIDQVCDDCLKYLLANLSREV